MRVVTATLCLPFLLPGCFSDECIVESTETSEVSGEATAAVECNGTTHALTLEEEPRWEQWDVDRFQVKLTYSDKTGATTDRLELNLFLPLDTPDGPLAPERPIVSVGVSAFTAEGSLTLERSRNYPGLDVDDPPEGPGSSTLKLSVALKGTYYGGPECEQAPFEIAPTTVAFRHDYVVATCEGDITDVRIGH